MIGELGIFLVSVALGALGSLMGFGAGVFIVPILSGFFGVPLKLAIAASALSVIVNSIGGAGVYLRARLTHVRLALLLELSTTAGAVLGGLLVVIASPDALRIALACVLVLMSVLTAASRGQRPPERTGSTRGALEHVFVDAATGREVRYAPRWIGTGMSLSAVAGVMSGLLGIGGGPIKVSVMNVIMRMPIKAAAGTSIYMVGITVSASALIYYRSGLIDPSVVVPAVLGVFIGSQTGARLAARARSGMIQWLLVGMLLYLAAMLFLQALHIRLPGLGG